MKNIKILFLLFMSYSQMKASEEAEFVVNAADSIQASQTLQEIAKKRAGAVSSFVSFFNPKNWTTPVDQNNPAVQHLHEIEAAIQDYYNNSKRFNKSTGNSVAQSKAKNKIETLVAEYRKKLDANDVDFVAYKSTFEDMIKDAQDQFSSLNLEEDTKSLLQPIIDYFANLLSSQPADKKEEKPADRKAAVTASVTLKNNSNESYQYDNRTATEASLSTTQNNQSISSNDNASAKEQEPTGWASKTLKYLNPAGSSKTEGPANVPNINNPQSNSYEGYGKPTDKKTVQPEHTDLNQDAQLRKQMNDAMEDYRQNAKMIGKSTGNNVAQAKALESFKKAVSDYINTFGTYSIDAKDKKYIASKNNENQAIQGKSNLINLLQLIDDKDHPAFGQYNTSKNIMIPLQRIEHDKDLAAHGVAEQVVTENVSLSDIIDFINKR